MQRIIVMSCHCEVGLAEQYGTVRSYTTRSDT